MVRDSRIIASFDIGKVVRLFLFMAPFTSHQASAGYKVCSPEEAELQAVCHNGQASVWCYDDFDTEGYKWGLSCHKTQEEAQKSHDKQEKFNEQYAKWLGRPNDTRLGEIYCKGCLGIADVVVNGEQISLSLVEVDNARQMVEQVSGPLGSTLSNFYTLLTIPKQGVMYGLYDAIPDRPLKDYGTALMDAQKKLQQLEYTLDQVTNGAMGYVTDLYPQMTELEGLVTKLNTMQGTLPCEDQQKLLGKMDAEIKNNCQKEKVYHYHLDIQAIESNPN